MPTTPHYTRPNRSHGGASAEEIQDEPDWTKSHKHRIGFREHSTERHTGYTHAGDDWISSEERDFLAQARKEAEELEEEIGQKDLVNVREFMTKQEDYHLRFREDHPPGWRYVLHTTEDFIKYQQDWPINIKRRGMEVEDKQKTDQEKTDNQKPQKEHEWRRSRGENETHHPAHATDQNKSDANGPERDENGEEKNDLQDKYSPQELSLLSLLQSESENIKTLEENDGKVTSPVVQTQFQHMSIDEADQSTPDNWIPRSPHLIRLTGKHPLNGESDIEALFNAGLITPNELHYVRNHGYVPHLLWETHSIDIDNGLMDLSMDDLANEFDAINIAVVLVCDGNRRKELNMIRQTKGFNIGPGAMSCAFWKGPLVRDVLLAAGIEDYDPYHEPRRRWVNFEGADEPSEGKYATSIPFAYVMDPENDVILAYEMNNVRLPPDHGYPVRLMVPGYIGGRCVKWLHRIWISDTENNSHYHIWDNRVLPSFIRDKDSEFAHAMFNHPSTACNEQNLDSIIVKPAQGETIRLSDVNTNKLYRIEGIAHAGGGHEVQRVEVSLDDGETWLYCVRNFPKYPVRHGNKFWTWIYWHVDVGLTHLVRAQSIIVRCFDVFKNTQPKEPSWNIMGMMNNCWYIVRLEIRNDNEDNGTVLFFRHPCEPGTGTGGWMQPSAESFIEYIKHEVAYPQKQFTREEIEKHHKEDDCWIVINGKVYDATSVLNWHPGGKAPIMAHAGRAHADTTEEFESIHDDYAEQKLSECVLGIVTDKTMGFIKRQAEDAAKERIQSFAESSGIVLNPHRWNSVCFKGKEEVSEDTRRYTFSLPDGMKKVGVATCQHLQLGFHFSDRLVIRPYTPTRPVFHSEEDGTFDLVVKTYFPDQLQPGGTVSNILDCLRPGEEIEVKGPTGEIKYNGQGTFTIDDKEYCFRNISLVLGGSGITPGYQLISRILRAKDQGEEEDKTNIKVINANKAQDDILLRDDLDRFARDHPDQFKIAHVLSRPEADWAGIRGHVSKEILQEHAFEPEDTNVALLCGPPAMIQKAVLPALKEIGYKEGDNLFGF
ncbi:nitrate reductase, putative [Talaromyces stipitatus ATCC 10500]|uniref:Nitrate reductase [NADPH] n=1 Tax=Talaromyces stipitatus (strain ATCC 10500 / CBS 375.48 / QM 6759 / NRRL 1006) TaxID=441959 RepID=B8LWZ7_TALSN|nr:nitrate reductase, putative [Talaromyces stipitatus ATCC 10500]EED24630.1 nitrate reductase, putative [Talaromyces stipitatus ATCC 10500]